MWQHPESAAANLDAADLVAILAVPTAQQNPPGVTWSKIKAACTGGLGDDWSSACARHSGE